MRRSSSSASRLSHSSASRQPTCFCNLKEMMRRPHPTGSGLRFLNPKKTSHPPPPLTDAKQIPYHAAYQSAGLRDLGHVG